MTNEARHAPRQLALPWGDGEKGGKGDEEKGSVGLRPVAHPLNTAPLTTAPLNTDPLNTDPSPHFYFPHPTAAEQSVLQAGADTDLREEIELTRVLLRRLLAWLDEKADDLPPEEMRRMSAQIFNGVRTVALLAGKHAARPPEVDDWLAAALEEMGEKAGWTL